MSNISEFDPPRPDWVCPICLEQNLVGVKCPCGLAPPLPDFEAHERLTGREERLVRQWVGMQDRLRERVKLVAELLVRPGEVRIEHIGPSQVTAEVTWRSPVQGPDKKTYVTYPLEFLWMTARQIRARKKEATTITNRGATWEMTINRDWNLTPATSPWWGKTFSDNSTTFGSSPLLQAARMVVDENGNVVVKDNGSES